MAPPVPPPSEAAVRTNLERGPTPDRSQQVVLEDGRGGDTSTRAVAGTSVANVLHGAHDSRHRQLLGRLRPCASISTTEMMGVG